jgi:hypothetical protein
MGLATLLGFPKGYFIPHRHAAGTLGPAPPYAAIEAFLRGHEAAFADVLALADRHAAALEAIGRDPPPAPRWEQRWFSRADGAAAYVLVRERRPARIVEIGSGHSTRFMARAVADGRLATGILAIDPRPRADIEKLGCVRHLGTSLEEAGLAPFATLGPGDVLFIDSSHVAMPGTDVDILVTRVVPALPAGVLIHIHDVCLPDGYFADWRWRGYNEQLLAAALLAGGGFRPLFASRYVATRMAPALAASVLGRLPLPEGARETSLWLEKIVPPIGPLNIEEESPPRVQDTK